MTSDANGAARSERFLSRWSRLKRSTTGEAATSVATSEAAGNAPVAPSGVVDPADRAVGAVPARGGVAGVGADAVATPGVARPAAADAAIASLPPIDSLTMESDFAPFMQAKVPDALRRAAVKKLFSDPHFNVMDGLDVYIDDYTKPDPLPEGWLEQIAHARDLINHPSNRKPVEEVAAAEVPPVASDDPVAGEVTEADATPSDGELTPDPAPDPTPRAAEPVSVEADPVPATPSNPVPDPS